MTLRPEDEHPHTPPDPCPDRWQENYFLLGWDDANRAGFYIHIERLAKSERVDLKAVVMVGEQITSLSTDRPLPPGLDTAELSISVEEPFVTWGIELDGRGQTGRDTDGFVAGGGGGDQPLAVHAVATSTMPPVDWKEALAGLPVAGIENDHYELGATWEGTITSGDNQVDAAGLLIRDHTWGVRDYSGFEAAWWTPVCFEGAEAFFTGTSILVGDRWMGVSILAADGEVVIMPSHSVEATSGEIGVAGYDSTRITADPAGADLIRLEARSRVHLPVRYPGFAPGYYMNDCFSLFTWGARTGFGTVELNTTLSATDLRRALDSASG